MRPKVAVVLFNLGGPDRPEAIRPFLVNLFSDPAILRVPFFVRPFLARRIAASRLAPARASYATLGGRSPLLELTRAQAAALEVEMTELDVKCFIAMRYWHPLSDETAKAVHDWKPDEVVLLPLYPQYSSTTTGSSLTAWREAAARVGLVADTSGLCCYPTDGGYIGATATLVQKAREQARAELDSSIGLRVLFSAHGLPEAIVQAGDPYQWQIEQTVAAVLAEWKGASDWVICYQSRATPQRWLEPVPSTRSSGPRTTRSGSSSCRSPLYRSTRRPWWNSMKTTVVSLNGWACPAIFGFRHGARIPPLSRRWRSWCAAHARTGLVCAVTSAGGFAPPIAFMSVPMTIGFLTALYPWTKALHIVSVIAWMAGMLYLPRLYVYHCEVKPGSAESERFKVMERRLLKQITNPAMIATWCFGVHGADAGIINWSAGWWHVKLALVLLMSGFHGALSRWRRDFLEDRNRRPQRFYRIANEVPTLLMVVIVVMVIVRPF